MPKRRINMSMAKYTPAVTTAAALRLSQNCMPMRNKIANRGKSTRDGITSQNICSERLAIFSVSIPSILNQMKASKDVTGKDAIKAANAEERFANSAMHTINIADTRVFNK